MGETGQGAAPLSGVRVVDMTSVVFGPYCTQILADLGADVIKIEPPEGDMYRRSGKPAKTRAMSPGHLALNRGKRSAVLDLKTPEDAETLRGLLRGADVFIHNVREGAIARLGFDAAAVQALKRDIIYVHCVGFGSDGPYADLQAYDDVIQAASGTASLLSRVDGDPRPRYFPSLIADKVAGLHAAYATLAAVVHKLRSGQGQVVEVAMLECFTHFMLREHLGGLTFDPPNAPVCYARQIDPHRQPFPTADGHISIVPYTEQSVAALLGVLGDPKFLEGEAFATPAARAANIGLVYQRIGELTRMKTTAAWMEILTAARIPAQPVRDIADILEEPHLKAVGFFERRDHPSEGPFYDMRQPVRFSASVLPRAAPAPTLGQHTAEIRAQAKDG